MNLHPALSLKKGEGKALRLLCPPGERIKVRGLPVK
jgi:hypothetical protein